MKRNLFVLFPLSVVILFFLSCATGTIAFGSKEYWPTKGWRPSKPEKQGMDSKTLSGINDYVISESPNTTSVLVVRNGYIVFEEYYQGDQDTLRSIKSATKGITSTLMGIAITEGIIENVDDKITNYLRDDYKNNVSQRANEITIKHLLTMTSGLPALFWDDLFSTGKIETILSDSLEYVPGEHWEYDNVNYDFIPAIITDTSGIKTSDFVEEKLFRPLGIADYFWMGFKDYCYGGERLQIKTRDIAKIGYLYLKKGLWDNKQLVSQPYIEEAIDKHIEIPMTGFFGSDETIGDGSLFYGYSWYTVSGQEYSSYFAYGYFACLIEVFPDLDMVIVITQDGTPPGHYPIVQDYILEALIEE